VLKVHIIRSHRCKSQCLTVSMTWLPNKLVPNSCGAKVVSSLFRICSLVCPNGNASRTYGMSGHWSSDIQVDVIVARPGGTHFVVRAGNGHGRGLALQEAE